MINNKENLDNFIKNILGVLDKDDINKIKLNLNKSTQEIILTDEI